MITFEINFLNTVILILLGYSIGVLSGFFGVGGSFILTPSLNILGIPMVTAVATGLTYAGISSTLAGIKHYIQKNIKFKIGIIIGLISIIGVRISQPIVIYLNELGVADFYIRTIYIILLILLGSLSLMSLKKGAESKEENKDKKIINLLKTLPPTLKLKKNGERVSIWTLICLGMFVGFLQGIMGVGGGFVLVPLFILVLKLQPRKAVGTSLMVILISCIQASILYMMSGKVDFYAVITLAIGTFFGVRYGTTAIKNIDDTTLQKFYALFLLMASIGIILKQLHLANVSLIYTFTLVVIVTLYILLKYYYELNLPDINNILNIKQEI